MELEMEMEIELERMRGRGMGLLPVTVLWAARGRRWSRSPKTPAWRPRPS